MEWSRIRSIAEEVELWMSLAVNGWIILGCVGFVIIRLGQRMLHLVRRVRLLPLVETLHFVSTVLLFLTLGTVFYMFIAALFGVPPQNIVPYIYWTMGVGICLSVLGNVLIGGHLLRRWLRRMTATVS